MYLEPSFKHLRDCWQIMSEAKQGGNAEKSKIIFSAYFFLHICIWFPQLLQHGVNSWVASRPHAKCLFSGSKLDPNSHNNHVNLVSLETNFLKFLIWWIYYLVMIAWTVKNFLNFLSIINIFFKSEMICLNCKVTKFELRCISTLQK